MVLPYSMVSKIHAFFLHHEGGWSLVDQRSRNCTYLNGERLSPGERHLLQDGDRIGFSSSVEFRFRTVKGIVESCFQARRSA